MSRLHPHAIQVLQKLELLPHSQWQCQQQAHKHNVHKIGPHTQSTRNDDQHDERVSRWPSQDDSTFGLLPCAPHPVPAMSSRPCNLAAASTTCQLSHLYAADDASHTLPPDNYMGQQFGPMPPQFAQLAPPAPTPLAGTMMMPYHAPYPQPHPF